MDDHQNDERITAATLVKFNYLVKAAQTLGVPLFPADFTRLLTVARQMSGEKLLVKL